MEPQTPLTPRTGLILVDDLMFASQIQGLARTAGVKMQWVRNSEQAAELCRSTSPACVILDVNLLGAAITDFVMAIKALGEPAPILIGFGSHVDAASLQHARNAGCNLVMPRSKLVQELSAKWTEWLNPK
jgi:DNA-binding response OmpR family regulator